MKKTLLCSLLFCQASLASPPVISYQEGGCPRLYMKMSGVCVNPELICHSTTQLREAVANYVANGKLAAKYDCSASSAEYAAPVANTTNYNHPSTSHSISVPATPDSCSELQHTLSQYQQSGVPLLNPDNGSIQQMDAESAQQVMARIQAQIARKCR